MMWFTFNCTGVYSIVYVKYSTYHRMVCITAYFSEHIWGRYSCISFLFSPVAFWECCLTGILSLPKRKSDCWGKLIYIDVLWNQYPLLYSLKTFHWLKMWVVDVISGEKSDKVPCLLKHGFLIMIITLGKLVYFILHNPLSFSE